MPFVYYGGKKGLARYYPPPAYSTIIEPFAGSAGYALHWATPKHRVVLVERDSAIVALWRRLQAPNAAEDIASIQCPPLGEQTTEPFIVSLSSSGHVFHLGKRAESYQVTEYMARYWRAQRSRLLAAIPRVRDWTIIEGDYTAAPDVRGTWFIDPPYWVPADEPHSRGAIYAHGAEGIDFDQLAVWCKARKGQAIVCEQEGAHWLPFRPLRRMQVATYSAGRRTEVVWTRTPGSLVATPKMRRERDEAARRRAARIRRG